MLEAQIYIKKQKRRLSRGVAFLNWGGGGSLPLLGGCKNITAPTAFETGQKDKR